VVFSAACQQVYGLARCPLQDARLNTFGRLCARGIGPPVVVAPLLFKAMDQKLAVLVAILGLDVAARPSAAELGSITGVCQLRR
jgi:hypothetical protein